MAFHSKMYFFSLWEVSVQINPNNYEKLPRDNVNHRTFHCFVLLSLWWLVGWLCLQGSNLEHFTGQSDPSLLNHSPSLEPIFKIKFLLIFKINTNIRESRERIQKLQPSLPLVLEPNNILSSGQNVCWESGLLSPSEGESRSISISGTLGNPSPATHLLIQPWERAGCLLPNKPPESTAKEERQEEDFTMR